jgi:membrane-associated protein
MLETLSPYFHTFIGLFTDLHGTLAAWISAYGSYIYGIFFCIIFVETGVVVFPFLPGDSLLFMAGAFAAIGQLNIGLMFFLLAGAAVLGDTCNYWIGHFIGPRAFKWKESRFFKPAVLKKTHELYEKHGGLFIVMARFMPFVRTYAPFFAGLGAMTYRRFIMFCVLAASLWVGVCLGAGYLLGNIPFVAKHFEQAIILIVLVSVAPLVIGYLKHRAESKKSSANGGRRKK